MRKFLILRRAQQKNYVLWCFGQYGQSVKNTSKIYIFGNIMTVFYCYIVLVMCCAVGGLATFTTKTDTSSPGLNNNHINNVNIKNEHSNKDLLSNLRLIIPPSHIALSGDLHVQIWYMGRGIFTPLNNQDGIDSSRSLIWPQNLVLDISRQDDDINIQLLTTIQILPDARALNANVTTLKLPCGIFSRGGPYILHLTTRAKGVNVSDVEDVGITKQLDVRWPSPRLSLTPEHVQTYPEGPVTAILEFPEVICPPVSEKVPTAIPEFWLELHFCGPSLVTCDDRRMTSNTYENSSTINQGSGSTTPSTQILYSEQVRGFPGRRVVVLRCELFGLAGHYALVLRPTSNAMPSVTSTAVYLKADWSEQFVFNVHARSIFPCDSLGGGVPVLFQYPACILQQGDRIRLYAKLRADVTSLIPPTSLEYVVEQKFTRGQHTLYFDCDLFVERYVEYCFVYVSQAITGAVADVRMDCVPTLPVTDSETGGWGEWSEWTPCTTTCAGGTRNRHRFCDSPPPRYGAKFCEGPAVQTEKCGHGDGATDWECMYGGGNSVNGDVPADRPEVKAEIGPGCRCGCVVHLGQSKPRRLVATSSQSCPGRTFWLIQADHDHVIRFKVDHFRLPCGSQWLKVRDGSSLSSKLISQLVGTPYSAPPAVVSTGPYLLLEFFSDELMAAGEICGGGFLAHAQQILHTNSSSYVIPVAQGAILMASVPPTNVKLTTVHIVALIFVSVVFIVSAGLIAQYILRYRKYQIAEDLDSFADISGSESNGNIAVPVRTSSSTTLLSEVISLTRLRPRLKSNNKHIRLRESVDCEAVLATEEVIDEDGDTDTQVEDGCSMGSTKTLQQPSGEKTTITTTTALISNENKSETKNIEPSSETSNSNQSSIPNTPKSSPLRRSNTFSSPSGSPSHHKAVTNHKCRHKCKSDNVSPDNISIENNTTKQPTMIRRHSNVSNITLTNGCYSPALSTVSRATIRTTSNPKENKEKRNRERLLAGPGSEFSLGPDTDLELDYYDYNVVNAGAAPGSYLGMDPAFLVWIPPLDDSGEILDTIDNNQQLYEDIRPKEFVDPGSNTESPDEEIVMLPLKKQVETKVKNYYQQSTGDENKKLLITTNISHSSRESLNNIPMQEFRKCGRGKKIYDIEKEIRVEKSPSDDDEFTEMSSMLNDEIKFADDEDDDDDDDDNKIDDKNEKNIYRSSTYQQQDTNILTN